jgi:hypothetical protein
MAKKIKRGKPAEIPLPGKIPMINPDVIDPEEPVVTEEDPDILPDEEMDATPPYEPPTAGEGP